MFVLGPVVVGLVVSLHKTVERGEAVKATHGPLLVLFVLAIAASNSFEVEETREKRRVHLHSLAAFHSFMETHNKTYNNRSEYKHRYRTFRKNMQRVKLLQETEQGTAVYGATHLADLTE